MDYIKEIKLILINYILGYAKKLFCKIRQKTIETSVDKIVDLIISGYLEIGTLSLLVIWKK